MSNKKEPQTILLVEDDEFLANMYKTKLELEKYNVIMVSNGENALRVVNEKKIDLILLDINLPNMDGYQIMALLQADEATKQTPVIALSANAMKNDIQRRNTAGFKKYLSKPINVKELISSINTILK